MHNEIWTAEGARWIGGSAVEVKAPFDLAEGAKTLYNFHDRVTIEGKAFKIVWRHDDEADQRPIQKGELVKFGVRLLT